MRDVTSGLTVSSHGNVHLRSRAIVDVVHVPAVDALIASGIAVANVLQPQDACVLGVGRTHWTGPGGQDDVGLDATWVAPLQCEGTGAAQLQRFPFADIQLVGLSLETRRTILEQEVTRWVVGR